MKLYTFRTVRLPIIRSLFTVHSSMVYEGESKSFRPDVQKPRQMENAARDI